MKHTYYTVFFGLLTLLILSACGFTGSQTQDSDGDRLSNADEMPIYSTESQNRNTDGHMILDGTKGLLTFKIDNQIDSNVSICVANANKTVKIFLPDGSKPEGQIDIPVGLSPTYQLNMSAVGGGGLGIQVNLWYWDREPNIPIQLGPLQNPDNSGDQFILNDQCEFTVQDAHYGKGVKTSKIATVSSRMDHGICVITIAPNNFTKCVTNRCCAPPISGWNNVCQAGDWYQSVCTPP